MTGYGYFLQRVLEPVSPQVGESGYFASPEDRLDPRLFDGDRIRPEVRRQITNRLFTFWGDRYKRPRDWTTVWIAGSGISYQWSAGRGNGDLDILMGIDYNEFFAANPKFQGMSDADLASMFNEELHQDLWPYTASTEIGGGVFEVTYYVNPGASDIRNINPYAAYNLTTDEWTVRPPSGQDFSHPQEYFKFAEDEASQARNLVERFNVHVNQTKGQQPGSPGWHNSMRQVDLLASQARSMYDDIHLGRKKAFSQGGSGYGDYYNFRWQYHKKNGTAQALHAVAEAHKKAHEDYASALYGGVIEGADVALRRAALWNRGANGRV